MLALMLQGNIIHYPVYLFLLVCTFLLLFLPQATYATAAYNSSSLGSLILGLLAESILNQTANTVFKDSGRSADIMTQLTCCVFLLLYTLWPQILFIPQAVQLLRAWCWWWWGKRALLLSPNTFFRYSKSHILYVYSVESPFILHGSTRGRCGL